MSVHFALDLFYFHFVQVELHFFSVFCASGVSNLVLDTSTMPDVDILKDKDNVAGLFAIAFGNNFTSMAIVDRALGGSCARKLRAVLPERGLKGEKAVVTAVRYFVIILALFVGGYGGVRGERWVE